MQDNFLAKLSHEIRTPINAIIGFGYLFQQTRLDDQQRKYLTSITDSAKDLLHIFQEMLDFSQMEEAGFALNPLPFRLETVMQNLSATIEPRCREKSLVFLYSIAPEVPPMLNGDAMRISQILLNLAGNAIKFTEKGSVSVDVSCTEAGRISFKVLDTGIGIPEESCKEIFKPFIQVDNSHTREHGGAGLGLATCYRLTQAMHGSIVVYPNKENGGGSVFDVTVPLEAVEAQEHDATSPLSALKVLVVDHEPLSQQVTEAALNSLGMHVSVAISGEEALQMIADADNAGAPFKLAILTWRMPSMNGIEAASYVQEMTLSQKPILILHSQYCLNEVEQLANDAGIALALPKPTSPADFELRIKELLENHTSASADADDDEDDDGPARILLVEDNEINQEIAYEVLKAAQLEVDIANNGQEAVDAVEKQKYSLILMDVQMPIMDGLEATRRIRAAGYRMPIIAMTAHAMLDDKETSLSAGMNAHLTKPLEPMALFATINSLLPTRNSSSAKKETVAKPTTAPVRKNKLPDSIEGFNLISGLATVGGNETLYASLLVKFADRYATVNEDISACLQRNDLETAVRHAHTVRGIAANLGAESLAEAAETLEKTLVHNPNMITPHLRTLVVRLTEAVGAIIEHLGADGAGSSGEAEATIEDRLNVAEREHACHVLAQAILHMEQDWGHASDTVLYLKDRLQGTPLERLVSQLLGAVEDFEVERAQGLSVEVQKLLHAS